MAPFQSKPGRIIPFVFLLLQLSSYLQAQTNEGNGAFYLFDENWKPTSSEKAVNFSRLKKIDDTTWQWDDYRMFGPLVKTETYKDKDANIAHGPFRFYNARGTLDSICQYRDGLAEGDWYYINDTGRVYLQKIYSKGRLIRTIDFIHDDSVKKEQLKFDADSLHKDEMESYFKGGSAGWQRFLIRNFHYPERAIKVSKQGTVVVLFIVDTEGRIQEPEIYQSVEYSLDEEALRIIRSSPNWVPAVQKGKKVKSYKKQPIIFRLQ